MTPKSDYVICARPLNNICLAYANIVLVQFSCVFSSVAALFSFLIQHLTAGDACRNTNSHFLSSRASDNLTLSNNNDKIEYTKLLIVLFHQTTTWKILASVCFPRFCQWFNNKCAKTFCQQLNLLV